MVTGSTATAYGDFLIASINTPYLNLKKVLSWELLAGVTDVSTPGKISFTEGSAIITGSGTNFTRLILNTNQIIIGNTVYDIDSVTNDTTLTLTEAIGFTGSGITYYRPTNSENAF